MEVVVEENFCSKFQSRSFEVETIGLEIAASDHEQQQQLGLMRKAVAAAAINFWINLSFHVWPSSKKFRVVSSTPDRSTLYIEDIQLDQSGCCEKT